MINKLGGKFTLIPTPILQLGTNANILKTGPQEVTEIFASHFAEISTKTAKENKREYKQSREELERMEKRLKRRKHDIEKHPDNQHLNSAFFL